MKKYNWVNDEINIDFKVPKSIEHQIEELERLDEEKNILYFDYCDHLDVLAKNAYAEGMITKKEWDALVMRYDIKAEDYKDV